ncbi:MAG: Omp28-related outer membrane protein [Bacteroidota bacterium]
MKKITFFTLLILFAAGLFAQTAEVAPYVGVATNPSLKQTNAAWTYQFTNSISSLVWGPASYGIESDGTYLYTTKYTANKFYKLTTAGALVDSFAITGATFTGGIRDLAYDGTYFYGSNFTNVVYKMDFTAKTQVSTITLPTGFLVRHIAFDPLANSGAGGLWCGPWNVTGPRLYSMTGAYLDSIPAANISGGAYAAAGSAYDNVTPGGPYLWLQSYTGSTTPTNINLIQIKLSTKLVSLVHDIMPDNAVFTSTPGGLFQKTNLISGTTTIGGLLQGTYIWGANLASTILVADGMHIASLNMQSVVQTNTPQTLTGTLNNTGSNTITAFNLNYSINGGATVTQNVTGASILGQTAYTYSHTTAWTPATNSTYTIKLWASSVNGTYNSDTLTKVVSSMATLYYKKAVLEEYTGIHCQYCPDGHKKANDYKALHPNDVFIINLHQGGYATPGAGEPDFRTTFGDALAAQTGLTGYPAATINRHVFSPLTVTATSDRTQWPTFGDQVLATPTYATMNIDSAKLDVQTRVLTVKVSAHYYANSPLVNMMNVALIQNNVEGPQTGAATWNPTQILPNGSYNHGHMLRHLLTGQWGDTILTTTSGTNFLKTYTYTLPASINLVDLDLGNVGLVGFIAEGKQEIITGAEKTPVLTNILYAKDISLVSITTANEICAPNLVPVVKVTSLGSDTVTSIAFSYTVNGGTAATYTWTGTMLPFSSKTITFPAITGFTVLASNAITIGVTTVNGVADQNTANNSQTKSNILKTSNTTSGATGHVFTFTQDQYGSESTWKITDDAANIIASGGPYADLTAAGVLAHPVNLTFSATGCYTLTVVDAYGDGINAGYGAGSYQLVNAANQVVVSSNGQYGTGEQKLFQLLSLIGIDENAGLTEFSLTPNPARDNVQLSFNTKGSQQVNVSIYNNLGALVYNHNEGVLTSGNHTLNVRFGNLSSGIYYMNLKAGENNISKKIVIE